MAPAFVAIKLQGRESQRCTPARTFARRRRLSGGGGLGLGRSSLRLAPLAGGAQKAQVARLVAAAQGPWDDVVILDQFAGAAGQAPSAVPLVDEAPHLLGNRLGQAGIELPLDALLIAARQHEEQGGHITGPAVA